VITALRPASGAQAGADTVTISVTVITPGGTSAVSPADRFTYLPPPTVSKVVPRSGPVGGGTVVSIAGANLGGASGVTFGCVGAQRFEVSSASSIVAIAPSEPVATVDVRVTTAGDRSAASSGDRYTFTPVITALTPSAGTTAGGTTVTVTGEGLGIGTGGTTIKFGTAKATPVACSSSTTCTAVSPAHAAGTVQMRAIVTGKSSSKSAATAFTYQ